MIANSEPTDLAYPSFGTSSSIYSNTPAQSSDIRQFYNVWLNFNTELEFSWKDLYRIEESMDRRTKRAVEKENLRERTAGRREYNETIRVSWLLFIFSSLSTISMIYIDERYIS